jgi:hypothetical protein
MRCHLTDEAIVQMCVDDVAGKIYQTLAGDHMQSVEFTKRGFKCVSMMWRAVSARPYRFVLELEGELLPRVGLEAHLHHPLPVVPQGLHVRVQQEPGDRAVRNLSYQSTEAP